MKERDISHDGKRCTQGLFVPVHPTYNRHPDVFCVFPTLTFVCISFILALSMFCSPVSSIRPCNSHSQESTGSQTTFFCVCFNPLIFQVRLMHIIFSSVFCTCIYPLLRSLPSCSPGTADAKGGCTACKDFPLCGDVSYMSMMERIS